MEESCVVRFSVDAQQLVRFALKMLEKQRPCDECPLEELCKRTVEAGGVSGCWVVEQEVRGQLARGNLDV